MFKRIKFIVWAFFASRDHSTPQHPRRNGSYGWPRSDELLAPRPDESPER